MKQAWLPLSCLLLGAAACAQGNGDEPLPWAYSAYFGTGRYRLDNGEKVAMITYAPNWGWGEARLDEAGNRSVRIELRLPLSIGLYHFSASGSAFDFDNVSTLSAVPGVEVEIPITPRWSLKPLAYAGWGTTADRDTSAWIYWTGIKSQLKFHGESFDWWLVNALTYVGHSGNAGDHGSAVPLLTGVEFDRPLANKKLFGKSVHLLWHVARTTYLNDVEFLGRTPGTRFELADEWEVGAAFSTGDEPLRLWRLHWDRVGLTYRFNNDGSFAGVGLTFKSMFDR